MSVCASVCTFVCVPATLELHTHLTECSTHIFRTFAVNINACLYLHGLLWAVCLLVLASACASLILWAKVWNERQRHIADGEVREAFKLSTVGLCSRGTPLPRLLTPATCFSPSCPSPLPQYLSLSPFWTSFSLPYTAAALLTYFFLSFTHLSLSLSTFSSPSLPPHPLPPSHPKEIWFPPLPGLFTMIPVCMADKDHIAPSIWRHLSGILYTRPFTHFDTLNTIETTSMLCVRWVLTCMPAVCVCTVQIYDRQEVRLSQWVISDKEAKQQHLRATSRLQSLLGELCVLSHIYPEMIWETSVIISLIHLQIHYRLRRLPTGYHSIKVKHRYSNCMTQAAQVFTGVNIVHFIVLFYCFLQTFSWTNVCFDQSQCDICCYINTALDTVIP